MRRLTVCFPVMVALIALNARAATINNGSFEMTTPSVPAGSFVNFLPGSSGLTGWTVVGISGTEVSVVNKTFASECCVFPAEDGSNWLDLTGDLTNNDTEGVAQTVATNIGDNYALTFWIGNVFDPNGIYGRTSTVDVSANGVSLGAFVNSCTACTATLTWQSFTTTFQATSNSTTLQFLNGDPSNDNSNGLDNISIVDLGPGTVPEPTCLMLVIPALLALAASARNRMA